MDILALVTSWWITTEVRERRHTDVSRTILIFLRSFAYNKQRENQEVNNLNILKCPNCGWNCVSLHKTPHGGRYYIGCANCHWVGPQPFFRHFGLEQGIQAQHPHNAPAAPPALGIHPPLITHRKEKLI